MTTNINTSTYAFILILYVDAYKYFTIISIYTFIHTMMDIYSY